MRKRKEIHLLPQMDYSTPDELDAVFAEKTKIASELDYIPKTLKELRQINKMDYMFMMTDNKKFYDAVIKRCSKIIDTIIQDLIEKEKCYGNHSEELDTIQTLDDLLNSDLLSYPYLDSLDQRESYERNRGVFIGILYDYLQKKGYLY